MWRHAVYPTLLIVSIGCLAWIDRSYRLAVWRDRRRAILTLVIAIVYFSVWDIVGIKLNIFYAADNTYRSGWLLGPSFPVEELLFLTLFCYSVLLGWTCRNRLR